MVKFEYENRYRHTMKLSEQQLKQMSGQHIISMFLENKAKLSDLPTINPKWIELMRYKYFPVYDMEELKKNGVVDTGRVRIKKAKKGYVLSLIFNWRSKGIQKEQYVCEKCKKRKKLNWHHFCEKCTKEIGGSRGIAKWINRSLRKYEQERAE